MKLSVSFAECGDETAERAGGEMIGIGKIEGERVPVPAQTSHCVLLVEDHDDTRCMLRTMLELRGCIRVVEAENGEMAVALARNVQIDLILMDTDLPLLDGYTATRRIREFTSTSEVPIVFLSGHSQPEAETKAFAAGCTEYLVKPFALDKLSSLLERHLSPQNRAGSGKGLSDGKRVIGSVVIGVSSGRGEFHEENPALE